MKKLLTLILLLLLLHNLNGQTIRDSIFNNVIPIERADVSTNGNDFLIDIPIKSQKEPIIIFNQDARIPLKMLFERKSFLYEQNEIILMESAYLRNPSKATEKVAPSIILYHIQRENSIDYKVDSLQLVWIYTCPITINYKKSELKENEVKYFFQECYGSTCCPRDPNWDFQQERNEMKNNFNKKYNVSVYQNVYRQILGRESEHCDYYTLSDLTNEQKIAYFRTPKPIPNSHLKDFDFSPIIILPKIIDKTNLIHKNPQKTNSFKRIVSGYVFVEGDSKINMSDVKIKIKGAEKERFTTPDFDGNFEIEAKKDEILIVSYIDYNKEIKITDENIYVISLTDIKGKRKKGKIPH